MKRKLNLIALSNEEISMIRCIRRGLDYQQDYGTQDVINWFCQPNAISQYQEPKQWFQDIETLRRIWKRIHSEHRFAMRALGGYGKWYREHIKPMEDKEILWNMLSCVPAKVITREEAIKLYDTK